MPTHTHTYDYKMDPDNEHVLQWMTTQSWCSWKTFFPCKESPSWSLLLVNHSFYTVRNYGRKTSRGFVSVFVSSHGGHIDMHARTHTVRAELVPPRGWTQSPLCPPSLCYLAEWVEGTVWPSSPLIGKLKLMGAQKHLFTWSVCTHAESYCMYVINVKKTLEEVNEEVSDLWTACTGFACVLLWDAHKGHCITHPNTTEAVPMPTSIYK